MNNSGRSRDSMKDINETLEDIISGNEHAELDEHGESSVPIRFIPDIFKKLEDELGYSILSPDEEHTFKEMLSNIEVQASSMKVSTSLLTKLIEDLPKLDDSQTRGRPRTLSDSSDSSSGSRGTSRNSSRPPSRSTHPPPTPTHPQTPLDKRPRSTPLSANPPSAYQRQRPPGRRKSDASPGRGYSSGAGDSDGASGPRRPRSRSGSQSMSTPSSSTAFPSSGPFSPSMASPIRDRFLAEGGSSPEDNTTRLPRQDYGFDDSLSRIPMPHSSDSDSSDDEHDGRGSPASLYTHLVFDPEHGPRSTTSSTASLLPGERVEALSRANTELAKRLQDAERTLQRKISEHESDLEELQHKMEELKSELARSKRDEKELRSKERTNFAQISGLEAELQRFTKDLAASKSSHNALQKQYTEQMSISEKYRLELRSREEVIRTLRDQASLQDIEIGKMGEREKEWEDRVAKLERDVEEAREGCAELERQKMENLGLKETIDRMRFEMDDMRSAMTSGLGTTGSSLNSRANTISKSLGAELQSQLEKEQRLRAEADADAGEDTEGEETVVEQNDQEDDEGNVVTTIIKRTRRKVVSKAQMELPMLKREYSGGKFTERRFEEFEDEKEYADCAVQYNSSAFFDPDSDDGFLRSTSSQTDPEPAPASPVDRLMAETDIQTDMIEEEDTASPSSSQTPTVPTDEPPAYPGPSSHSSLADKARETQQAEKEEQAELSVLRKWHRSLDVMDVKDILSHSPRGSLSVSKDIMKDWARVQRAAGVDCTVVDRLLRNATGSDEEGEEEENDTISEYRLSFRRLSTHLPNFKFTSYIPQTLIFTSLSIMVGVVLAPHMGNQMNEPIGGATYYDRRAWSSFNTLGGGGEGFPGFGVGGHQGGAENALWKVVEAIVGGGARYVRGLPT